MLEFRHCLLSLCQVAAALKAKTVSTYIEGQLVSSTQILSRTLVYLSFENLAENLEVSIRSTMFFFFLYESNCF